MTAVPHGAGDRVTLARVTVYKFLAPGRRHPISGVELPPPGAWFAADHPAADGPEGVRAHLAADLASWVDEELWEVELDGERSVLPYSVVAARGRLVRRVEAWTPAVARAVAADAAWRARDAVAARLDAAGHADVAADVRAAGSLADLAAVAAARSAAAPAGWADPLGLVAEVGAEAAAAPVVVALLTATVAVAGWDAEAHLVERRWQSARIAERLGLPPA